MKLLPPKNFQMKQNEVRDSDPSDADDFEDMDLPDEMEYSAQNTQNMSYQNNQPEIHGQYGAEYMESYQNPDNQAVSINVPGGNILKQNTPEDNLYS